MQVGEETTPDDHGVILPSAGEAARDAVEVAAAMMSDVMEIGRTVTVTVRSDGATLLRVRGVLTIERVEQDA